MKKGLVQPKFDAETIDSETSANAFPWAWKQIVVPEVVNVLGIHEHPLKYIEDLEVIQEGDGEWCCNGVEIFKSGCKSG